MPAPDDLLPTERSTAIVFAGGDPPDHRVLRALPPDAYVIAADSGLVHAQQAGFDVDVVVGDLDSVPADALDDARIAGVEIARFPEDKDDTDLQLAFERALAVGVDTLILLSADGGRPDHFLANIALLAHERYATIRTIAYLGRARLEVVRHEATFEGTTDDVITLLAVGGPVTGITTSGLRWPLAEDTLVPGESRGVGNTFATANATVRVRAGALLVIQPEGTR